jgi:hypothetical protein
MSWGAGRPIPAFEMALFSALIAWSVTTATL